MMMVGMHYKYFDCDIGLWYNGKDDDFKSSGLQIYEKI